LARHGYEEPIRRSSGSRTAIEVLFFLVAPSQRRSPGDDSRLIDAGGAIIVTAWIRRDGGKLRRVDLPIGFGTLAQGDLETIVGQGPYKILRYGYPNDWRIKDVFVMITGRSRHHEWELSVPRPDASVIRWYFNRLADSDRNSEGL
jgi:hypothetical protein